MVFAVGATVYVAAYGIFAVGPTAWPVLLLGFAAAGIGIGFAETAESTVVAQLLPDGLRGIGFGVLGLVQSLGDLGSSAVVGLLWALVSPQLAFGYAAVWMLASLAATRLTSRRPGNGGDFTRVSGQGATEGEGAADGLRDLS